MKTFRILSALLCYPEAPLLAALPDFPDILLAENALPAPLRQRLFDFIDDLGAQPLLDAQERYVALFDRNRSLSLHIYEHVHGESRDRGQAMVRLAEMYRLHGLVIGAAELPDYLPLFLEFLSNVPDRAARSLLADAVHVVAALEAKLRDRNSPYAAVLAAVAALAARPAAEHLVNEALATLPEAADDFATLDRQWTDEAVRFAANDTPELAACKG